MWGHEKAAYLDEIGVGLGVRNRPMGRRTYGKALGTAFGIYAKRKSSYEIEGTRGRNI